jgi:hypothetical protein
LLASAGEDGSTFLWDAKTGEHLLTLISLDDGGEWMVVTPQGLFDGTPVSWNQILWRYNQETFNVAPIEWFFNEFYHPGLLSDVFAGKRPKVAQDVSKKDRRQPLVKLSLPREAGQQADAPIASRTVKVKIDITDAPADKDNPQGTGARDVRLFRNGSLVKVWHGDVLKGQPSATLPHIHGWTKPARDLRFQPRQREEQGCAARVYRRGEFETQRHGLHHRGRRE